MINTKTLIGSALAAATTLGCDRSLRRPGRPARVLVREVLRRRQGRPERLPDCDAFLRRHLDRRQPGRLLGLRAGRHLRQAHRRQRRAEGLTRPTSTNQPEGADRCLTRFQPSRSRKPRASVFARRTSRNADPPARPPAGSKFMPRITWATPPRSLRSKRCARPIRCRCTALACRSAAQRAWTATIWSGCARSANASSRISSPSISPGASPTAPISTTSCRFAMMRRRWRSSRATSS